MKISNLIPTFLRASAEPESVSFSAPVDIQAAAGEGSEAKRPTFSIDAYGGGIMTVNAFYLPVVLDLKGLKAARSKLPILLNHDLDRPIGQAEKVTIDAAGVKLEGTITGDDEHAQRVITHAKNGFQWQASIGAQILRRETLEAGKTIKVNGRDVTGPLLIARESRLVETSFVSIGADQTTSATVAASHITGDSSMEFTKWLEAKGIDEKAVDEATMKVLKAAYEAEQAPPTPEVKAQVQDQVPDVAKLVSDAVAQSMTAIAGEQKRTSAIMAATAGHAEIQAKALTENWTAEKAELEVMRASRPHIGQLYVNSGAADGVATDSLMTAALCQSGGLQGLESTFDDKTLEAAHKRYRGQLGVQQMLLAAAWAGGYTGSHFDRSPGGMRDILRAAFSSSSIPGILSNVANKFLLQGFMGVEQAWRAITAIRSVNDFKQVTSYRLTGAFQFEQVAPDGQLKHTAVDEQSFTNQAKTYGIMHAITRTDIINDDLGALTAIPQRIGRGGALKLNSVFWTEFLDHAAFFYTNDTNKNYISGSTTTPGIAGLNLAVTKFRRQTDPDGKPLGLQPSLVLCPPEQEASWLEINRSVSVNTGGSSSTDQVPNANIFAGRYPPVVSAYLTSTLEWYLLANPSDLAVIETCFLNGVQQPTIESADADFNTLGVQMRGVWDFGVAKQDPRAGVKSKGAS